MSDYRRLTEDEAILMRFWLGERLPTNMDCFPTWKDYLCDQVYQARKTLGPGLEFEFYHRPDKDHFFILASSGGDCWAISRELQDGLTRRRLQEIHDCVPADMSWKKFYLTADGLPTIAGGGVMGIASILIAATDSSSLAEVASFLLKLGGLAALLVGLAWLIRSFRRDNPLWRRQVRAEIGMAHLRLVTAPTEEERAAQQQAMLEGVPSKETVLASMGGDFSAADPQPAT